MLGRRLFVRSRGVWRGKDGTYEPQKDAETLFLSRLSKTDGRPFLFGASESGETAY